MKTAKTANRRSPKQARSAQTIECILDAAASVLSDVGIDGFSTVHVASVADLSVGTLYQYYKDKYELLEALMARWLDQAAMEAGDLVGEDRIRAVFASYRDQPGGHELLAAFRGTPRLRPILEKMMHRFAETTAIRLTGNQKPSKAEVTRASVLAIASDAVLSAAAQRPPREANAMVSAFAEWAAAFSVDPPPESKMRKDK